MSIFSTSYSDSDIAQIQQLLENAEKVPVTCEREFSGIWFQSEDREKNRKGYLCGTPPCHHRTDSCCRRSPDE